MTQLALAVREPVSESDCRKREGETGQALKTVAESLAAANPYRYVRIYTGYGRRGAELLEEYRKLDRKTETVLSPE